MIDQIHSLIKKTPLSTLPSNPVTKKKKKGREKKKKKKTKKRKRPQLKFHKQKHDPYLKILPKRSYFHIQVGW